MPVEEVNPFKITRLIKRGHFSDVKLARHSHDHNRLVTLKIAYKVCGNDIKLRREYEVLQRLNCGEERDDIVRMCWEFQLQERKQYLFLVLGFIDGRDLEDVMAERRLAESEVRAIMASFCAALAFIHRCGVAHLDVKPANVMLLPGGNQVKVIDFGLSEIVGDRNRHCELYKSVLGNNAPELLSHKPYDGKLADVWSTAMLLLNLITGVFKPLRTEMYDTLTRETMADLVDSFPQLSTDVKNLLKAALVVESSRRINLDQMRSHHWFQKL